MLNFWRENSNNLLKIFEIFDNFFIFFFLKFKYEKVFNFPIFAKKKSDKKEKNVQQNPNKIDMLCEFFSIASPAVL